jgi:serine/threonine-protein kinase
MMARVRHPNVAAVYAIGHAGDEVALAMELVRGRTLDDLVRAQGPLGWREACLVGTDLCGALAAVHAAGLVHRDIKARNVMRETGGRIVLMDFGMGVDLAAEAERTTGSPLGGTPPHMAPEVPPGRGRDAALGHLRAGRASLPSCHWLLPARGADGGRAARGAGPRPGEALRDARPELPEAFLEAVEKALALVSP